MQKRDDNDNLIMQKRGDNNNLLKDFLSGAVSDFYSRDGVA